MKYWYLGVLSIVFTFALAFSEGKRKMGAAVLFKALSSVSFVILGILSFQHAIDRKSALYLLMGLIFGAVGDVLLNVCHLVNESPFVFFLGGVSFLVGHVLYLIVLVPMAASFVWPAVGAGLFIAAFILFFLHRKAKTEAVLFLESMGYMLAVSLMASFSVFGLVSKSADPARILRAVGGILFLASDTMLFIRLVRKEKAPAVLGFFVLITYYPAQCLIAMSMQYI